MKPKGGVDLGFGFAVGVLECLGDVREAGDEIPDLSSFVALPRPIGCAHHGRVRALSPDAY